MKLKGIVFDGDGVLFDTEKLHVLAWKKVFKHYNINLSKDDFEEGIGVDDKIFLKKLKDIGKIRKDIDIEETIEKKYEELLKIINKKNIGVSNKIKKVIKYLKDKYKIGIASNSEKKFVLKVLELSGLNKFIDVVVTKSDVQNPKPFPDIYNKVSKKLKIPISNLIAFEDSETGILSAKTSGIFCVGVLTTQPLEKIKMADIIIDEINLKNVKKIIKIFEGKNENKKY